MPGIPTHLRILDLVLAELRAEGGLYAQIADHVNATPGSPEWACLGACGALVADFIPADPATNRYVAIWQRVFNIISDDPVTGATGLLSAYQQMYAFLDTLHQVAISRDSNALALLDGQLANINKVTDTLGALTKLINNLLSDSLMDIQNLRPAIEAAGPAPPPSTWRVREFLFWKRPGAFAKALIDQAVAAAETGSANAAGFFAYALGYLSFYATSVCGSPFVNSIVGGPYRTQWWRHRWINNHVDTWAHGYYEAGKPPYDGDPTNSDYRSWPDICGSKLQDRLDPAGSSNLPPILKEDAMARLRSGQAFAQILPPEFGTYWFNAYEQAYGPGTSPLSAAEWAAALNSAFVLTWLVLWFQTSGEILRCGGPPQPPPNACGKDPSWANPGIPGDAGAGTGPPPPQKEEEVNSASTVSGVILAILGAIAFLAGAWVAGLGGIAAGIALAKGGKSVNWDQMLCDEYWYRLYLYNLNSALRTIASLAGLAHPAPSSMANDILGAKSFELGANVARASAQQPFPYVWDGFSNWWVPPGATLENNAVLPSSAPAPAPVAWLTGGVYPDFFIDSPANPLSNGKVINPPNTWPAATPNGNSSEPPIQFGNAVANIVDLVKAVAPTLDVGLARPNLPDWNLDGDRGLAWQTWEFAAGTGASNSPIKIKKES